LRESGSVLSNKHWQRMCRKKFTEYRKNNTCFGTKTRNKYSDYWSRAWFIIFNYIQRILKGEKLHAFHYIPVHFRVEDYHLRRRFCENFLRKVDRDLRFSSRVIFSDKSLFTRERILNSHNMYLWSEENLRVTRLRNFQTRWKINIWELWELKY